MSNTLEHILTDEEYKERVKEGKDFLITWRHFKEEDADNIMQSAIKAVKAIAICKEELR